MFVLLNLQMVRRVGGVKKDKHICNYYMVSYDLDKKGKQYQTIKLHYFRSLL